MLFATAGQCGGAYLDSNQANYNASPVAAAVPQFRSLEHRLTDIEGQFAAFKQSVVEHLQTVENRLAALEHLTGISK